MLVELMEMDVLMLPPPSPFEPEPLQVVQVVETLADRFMLAVLILADNMPLPLQSLQFPLCVGEPLRDEELEANLLTQVPAPWHWGHRRLRENSIVFEQP